MADRLEDAAVHAISEDEEDQNDSVIIQNSEMISASVIVSRDPTSSKDLTPILCQKDTAIFFPHTQATSQALYQSFLIILHTGKHEKHEDV